MLKILVLHSLIFFSSLSQAQDLKGYLPKEIAKEFLTQFRKNSSNEIKNPPLLFASGQSFSHNGLSVLNRIQYFKGEKIDIWSMKQSEQGHGFNFKTWTPLAIVVDNTSTPKKSYYLQFENGSLKPAHYSASCFTCHSSGPRAIRPKYSDLVPSLSSKTLAQVSGWNKIIENYRNVKTYEPPIDPGSGQILLGLPGLKNNEQFTHKNCIECHNSDGVRAPLLRQHKDSIEALLDNTNDVHGFYISAINEPQAFMPLEGPKISAQDRICITDWLENTNGHPPMSGCNMKGEAIFENGTQYIVDPIHSHIAALATSTFGKITLKNFFLSGNVLCKLKCLGEIRADLRQVHSGIELRDKHLRENYIDEEHFPFAILNFDGASQEKIFNAQFSLAGVSSLYPIKVSCKPMGTQMKCSIDNFVLSLKAHNIPQPQFLGAEVKNDVDISGEILLQTN